MILHFLTLAGLQVCHPSEIYQLYMGIRDLPDIYALALVFNGPRARAYISGKSLVPMLQLLHECDLLYLFHRLECFA